MSSLLCSPGHSAGTFISHLLWHVYPQSRQSNPLADNPQIRSPHRSQLVGILKVCDLKLWFCAPMDKSPTTAMIVDVSTSAATRLRSISWNAPCWKKMVRTMSTSLRLSLPCLTLCRIRFELSTSRFCLSLSTLDSRTCVLLLLSQFRRKTLAASSVTITSSSCQIGLGSKTKLGGSCNWITLWRKNICESRCGAFRGISFRRFSMWSILRAR